jgi:hypothetical protein
MEMFPTLLTREPFGVVATILRMVTEAPGFRRWINSRVFPSKVLPFT